MNKTAKQPAWWDEYRQMLSPDFLKFLHLESTAVAVRQYQLRLIPGLLQTPEYTRTLATHHTHNQERAERIVQIRQTRQKRLNDKALKHFFILDESLLYRRITDADHWRLQLRHLITIAEKPNVTLRIMPFSAGWITGFKGSFELLQLSNKDGDLFLDLEFCDGDVFFNDLVGPEKALEYSEFFHRLEAASIPAEQTPQVIEQVIRNLEDPQEGTDPLHHYPNPEIRITG